jgi:hypothetical protein
MSDWAIEVIFLISGLLCVAWVILDWVKRVRARRQLEREITLEEMNRQANEEVQPGDGDGNL